MALVLEQSPPGLAKQAINAEPGQAAAENARRAYTPPTLKRLKKKHLPGVEVLESCQSVKAGSYFFVSGFS